MNTIEWDNAIVFYFIDIPDFFGHPIHKDYISTSNAIARRDRVINTTQVVFIEVIGELINEGYKVYIYDQYGMYEVIRMKSGHYYTTREPLIGIPDFCILSDILAYEDKLLKKEN